MVDRANAERCGEEVVAGVRVDVVVTDAGAVAMPALSDGQRVVVILDPCPEACVTAGASVATSAWGAAT